MKLFERTNLSRSVEVLFKEDFWSADLRIDNDFTEYRETFNVFAPLASIDMYMLTMTMSWLRRFGKAHLLNVSGTFECYLRRFPMTTSGERRKQMVLSGVHRLHGTFFNEFLSRTNSERYDVEFLTVMEDSAEYLMHRFSHAGFPVTREEIDDLLELFISPGMKVNCMAEGAPVMPNTPVVGVTGNPIQGQIVETYVLACVNSGTGIASKARELRMAAPELPIIEGGSRRKDPDAALWGAFSAHVGGASSTSLAEAGEMFDIPCVGTMAHSHVMIHDAIEALQGFKAIVSATEDLPTPLLDDSLAAMSLKIDYEYESFRTFVLAFGAEDSILLVDTYDVYACVEKVIRICEEFEPVKGIRLDSGDVMAQARYYRKKLDAAGLYSVKVFASNGFDTDTVRKIVKENVPIDGVLIGERLLCVADAPVTGFVYKMVEMGDVPTGKYADGKVAYPFEKEVIYHHNNLNLPSVPASVSPNAFYSVERVRPDSCSELGTQMLLPIRINGVSEAWLNPGGRRWPTEANFSDEIKDAYKEIGMRHGAVQ